MKNALNKQSAFTLIELSIVIVIIGLIIAGVVAGSSLIQAAKTRSVISELRQYTAAANTFRLAYGTLPGDLSNAYDFWGSSCSTTQDYCNGDGDKSIDSSTATNLPGQGDTFEGHTFWQHMALAGMISGNYYGVPDTSLDYAGRIMPRSAYGGYANAATYIPSGDRIWITGVHTNRYPELAVLKHGSIRQIDQKMDDGQPRAGKMLVYDSKLSVAAPWFDCTSSTSWGYCNDDAYCCRYYWDDILN